jgi:hypothetical protein
MDSKSKTRLRHRMLALLWIFPSGGALLILGMDCPNWFRAPNAMEGLASVAFQSWIALVLLLSHGVFLVKARPFGSSNPTAEAAGQAGSPADAKAATTSVSVGSVQRDGGVVSRDAP